MTLEQRYARHQRLRATPEYEAFRESAERFVEVQDRPHTRDEYRYAMRAWHAAELLGGRQDDLLGALRLPQRIVVNSAEPSHSAFFNKGGSGGGHTCQQRLLLRLVGMPFAEQDGEWSVGRDYLGAKCALSGDGRQGLGRYRSTGSC